MSAETPSPIIPQTTAGIAAEIEAFFNGLDTNAQLHQGLHHETGICQFNISGVGTWLVSVKNGVPTLVRDATPATPPGAAFICSPEVFVRILHGEGHLNPVCAVLQGLVEVSGDPALASAVLQGN
jgi:hypothetical protein